MSASPPRPLPATTPGFRGIAQSPRRLEDEGAGSAYLGVDADNADRALALYESCGFRVASRSPVHRKPFDHGGRTT
jgi:hypothetical protein